MTSTLGTFLAQLAQQTPQTAKTPEEDVYAYLARLTQPPPQVPSYQSPGKSNGMSGLGTALASGLGIGGGAAGAAGAGGLGALAAL